MLILWINQSWSSSKYFRYTLYSLYAVLTASLHQLTLTNVIYYVYSEPCQPRSYTVLQNSILASRTAIEDLYTFIRVFLSVTYHCQNTDLKLQSVHSSKNAGTNFLSPQHPQSLNGIVNKGEINCSPVPNTPNSLATFLLLFLYSLCIFFLYVRR